ncbi:MAG: COG4280 domain-containing protein [Candidatus Dormibacteria bacterium]
MTYAHLFTFGAAFLGSAVESIEALTIVLAVGLTRGWRAPLYGTLAALASLVILVAAFGELITTRVPESALKLVIGTLILLFGLRWLHKAILRSAGVVALHDEEKEFAETVRELNAGGARRRDWVGFTIAFKGVFLEGVEVAFIVFAVGTNSRNLPVAAAGGIAAMFAVAAAGVVVRHPLSRVPENTLKYSVGLILASLGTFWAAEGMGATWPLDFVSIVGLALLFYLASRVAVGLIRSGQRAAPA